MVIRQSFRSLSRIDVSLIALLVIALTAPPLQMGRVFFVFAICAAILWLTLTFSHRQAWYLRPTLVVKLVYLTSLWMVGYALVVGHPELIEWNFSILLFYFLTVSSHYYFQYDKKVLLNLFWLIVFTFPIWCVLSVRALAKDPYILRSIKSNYESYSTYYQQGIGSYLTVYAAVIICLVCLYLVTHNIKVSVRKKMAFLVVVITSGALVIYSGYMIANIALLSSAIFLLAAQKIESNLARFTLVSTFLISLVLIKEVFLEKIFSLIEPLVLDTPYQMKLYDIRDSMLNFSVSGDSVLARFDTYAISIDSFFSNPFFGSGVSSQVQYGNHSTILDTFAVYGSVIGVTNLFILFSAPFVFVGFKGRKANLAIAIIWANGLILISNNISYTYAVALLITLPAASIYELAVGTGQAGQISSHPS